MNKDTQTCSVPTELQGKRIDIVLAQLFPQFSRSQLSQWLKQGIIQVNQKNIKSKDKMQGGETISYPEPWPNYYEDNQLDQPEDIPLSIVYEDPYILIINKPRNLVVHPGAGNREHTLVNALLHHYPCLGSLPRAGIIHRIDKDTTGLLLIAKDLPSYNFLSQQMQQRAIHRHYIALVAGDIIAGGTIDTFFGRHSHNRLKMAVKDAGKSAITHYRVTKHYQGFFTLLDISLETGRTHQIRVHMAHIEHPIIGDPLYGKRPKLPKDIPQDLCDTIINFRYQALHAAKLTLMHPTHHEILTFTADMPDDLQYLLHSLDNYFAIPPT